MVKETTQLKELSPKYGNYTTKTGKSAPMCINKGFAGIFEVLFRCKERKFEDSPEKWL